METLRIGGRRYSDPDVISLCQQTGGLIDPRSTVVHMARLLLGKINGFPGVPRDPLERLKIIASLVGIKIQPMDMDHLQKEKRDAALYPTSSGLKVLYNPNRPKPRVVFTIAHEVVHTFFPNSTSGARFRSITHPDSREANELERLCDLGAAELVMPLEDFQRAANGTYSLTRVEQLASEFGTSIEATTFRLASAHPGVAIAGLLRYRHTLDEGRRQHKNSKQQLLFLNPPLPSAQPAEKKYRRQSLHVSSNCEDEHLIRWNKSFDRTSVVYKAREGGVHRAVESLPNQSGQYGQIEAILCPFQREEADGNFGDVLFFWQDVRQ
jgi:Zn-dependent peptidase ImmA (M78 family)